ncbi:sensory transduction histidine kinase [Methanosarcina barkeri 3]|uniref:Sensory transduction histidine kinase n=1 Tax=Methanosarcina barkeri 3 TaxID=1434107 RepID=A0A0E3SFB7_METBA|nr:histidine kinase dimerization/phosphoacceptor domain -containing protein [Methanosarcina barkeri]AKB80989.1 sensory transduction histidine kinase [Methanosarcina barkeri 3]
MDKKVKILLFEDNPGDAGLIEEMIEEFADFQYELKTFQTLNEGLNHLKENRFDIILSDLGLPDSDGIDTFLEIHARNSRIPIIILTGMNDEKIGVEAVKKGAQDYLVKGQVDGRLLRRSIQYSIERKKAEERVQNLANIVESSNDAIVTRSLDGFITSWNLGAEQIYGYLAEEVLGKPATVLIPCSLKNEIQKLTEMIKQGEKIHQYETSRLRKDGKVINVSMTLSPVFDISGELMAISVISRDITESKKAEEARKKEIHHRIKNNLQVISSLLDLQAEKFASNEVYDTSKVLAAFRDSQNRVISMALIHEELYGSKEVSILNFATYLQKLTEELFRCYNVGASETEMVLEIEENIFFDMDTAVPLGMIVNELVSNSLKHAFPSGKTGKVQIKLSREISKKFGHSEIEDSNEARKGASYILIVSDNGVGIPESISLEDSDTLGIQLVTILVDQLDGELDLNRTSGTEFTIKIKVAENK